MNKNEKKSVKQILSLSFYIAYTCFGNIENLAKKNNFKYRIIDDWMEFTKWHCHQNNIPEFPEEIKSVNPSCLCFQAIRKPLNQFGIE